MESLKTIAGTSPKLLRKPQADKHLHSPAHLLADEISKKLNDRRHFGFYLKMAIVHDHAFLRRLAGEVMESGSVKSPGKLFAYLIKKHG
ncbi:MAG: hypothetical protein HYZ51_01345 [Candidatus Doudnabacteria bacterium]|nr:hypothetical protein [Candidatus Doudnabacteria bacterium]